MKKIFLCVCAMIIFSGCGAKAFEENIILSVEEITQYGAADFSSQENSRDANNATNFSSQENSRDENGNSSQENSRDENGNSSQENNSRDGNGNFSEENSRNENGNSSQENSRDGNGNSSQENSRDANGNSSQENSRDANEIFDALRNSPAPSRLPSATFEERGGEMREITTMQLVHDMGIGINLGNTLETFGDWIRGGVSDYERAWGSPIITEALIRGYAEAGFGVVRIPVAWSNLMGENYTISIDLLDRAEEIIRWVIKNDMYAIVNIHYDGGWWENFPTDWDGSLHQFTRFWEQISARFENYGDKLIFSAMNEEGGWNSVWNRYSRSDAGKADSYGMLNRLNQHFVDLIRASGGNNSARHLLIGGYQTDFELTVDPLFEIPRDPQNRLAVSVHYYTPAVFAILEQDATWGKMRMDWGTDADFEELNRLMDMVKHRFIDAGVPVILGEFGSPRPGVKDDGAVYKFITSVAEAAFVRGFAPILWCVSIREVPERGVFFSRVNFKMIDPKMEQRFREISQMERAGR
ncbi:MAG: cellulase family glycosylhydrolase [Defluviitaleaceae bacterium]|nr:cellulase family glycosylhydrolase [Defluviitaleaceae bacterium]